MMRHFESNSWIFTPINRQSKIQKRPRGLNKMGEDCGAGVLIGPCEAPILYIIFLHDNLVCLVILADAIGLNPC